MAFRTEIGDEKDKTLQELAEIDFFVNAAAATLSASLSMIKRILKGSCISPLTRCESNMKKDCYEPTDQSNWTTTTDFRFSDTYNIC